MLALRSIGQAASAPKSTASVEAALPEQLAGIVAKFANAHPDGGTLGLPRLTLDRGQVIVDGRRIADPRVAHGTISWHEAEGPMAYAGCLHVMAQGAVMSGMIAQGTDPNAPHIEHVTLAPPDIVYATQLCRQPKSAPQDWTPGPKVTIGVSVTDGGLPMAEAAVDGVRVDVAVLPPRPDGPDVQLSLTIDPLLTADGGALSGKPYPIPTSGVVAVAFDGESFTGNMTLDGGGDPLPWRGKAVPASGA